jgi:uncharacterized membrane protein
MARPDFGVVWRAVLARPRIAAGIVCGVAAGLLVPAGAGSLTRFILGWDIGCAVFLALVALMFATAPMDRMPFYAARDQEGEWTIFWLTIAGAVAGLAAIIGEFSASKTVSPAERGALVVLVAVTLLVSWLTTHTLFALRYAHEYYDTGPEGSGSAGGLGFPGNEPPDYWDFFYFALVLGMTFQVSDVTIQARPLRRLASAHGLIGFLFNTVILAIAVNIGASLL